MAIVWGGDRSGTEWTVFEIIAKKFLVIAWIAAGIIVLCTVEDMNFLTACYGLMQIVTTVGYGDITFQTSDTTKLFLSFYVLVAAVIIGGIIIQAVDKSMESTENSIGAHIQELAHVDNKITQVTMWTSTRKFVVTSKGEGGELLANSTTQEKFDVIFHEDLEPTEMEETAKKTLARSCSQFNFEVPISLKSTAFGTRHVQREGDRIVAPKRKTKEKKVGEKKY